MKIKIISDGTTQGTRVVNEETGETVERIKAVEWTLTAPGIAHATLTFIKVPVEIVAEVSG